MSHGFFTGAGHAGHALKHAADHDGVDGAVYGAVGVGTAAATGLALAGLALTPIGWGLALGLGATAGGTGLFKKLKEKF